MVISIFCGTVNVKLIASKIFANKSILKTEGVPPPKKTVPKVRLCDLYDLISLHKFSTYFSISSFELSVWVIKSQ